MSRIQPIDEALLRGWPLPPLDHEGDKESRGRVVIVAGSREIPGAALLAARAALRAGAGKVLVGTAESAALALAVAVPELRVVGLPENAAGGLEAVGVRLLEKALAQADAVLVGPGLQDEEAAIRFAQAVRARHPELPTLLDAAAMGAASQDPRAGPPVIVTPHAGEMAHLNGQQKDSVLADPEGAAREAARWWNSLVVLKGATTFIADPQGRMWLHAGGNAGLATAGSGDVLAGLMAGFAARGAPLELAAAWGVAVHARAGACLAERMGGAGFLASELAAEVPRVLERLAPAARPGIRPFAAGESARR